jgi:hypothetical protein
MYTDMCFLKATRTGSTGAGSSRFSLARRIVDEDEDGDDANKGPATSSTGSLKLDLDVAALLEKDLENEGRNETKSVYHASRKRRLVATGTTRDGKKAK